MLSATANDNFLRRGCGLGEFFGEQGARAYVVDGYGLTVRSPTDEMLNVHLRPDQYRELARTLEQFADRLEGKIE